MPWMNGYYVDPQNTQAVALNNMAAQQAQQNAFMRQQAMQPPVRLDTPRYDYSENWDNWPTSYSQPTRRHGSGAGGVLIGAILGGLVNELFRRMR